MEKTDVVQEWLRQANYDYATASAMFDVKRHIYCVFMCHLALEKTLKAIYASKYSKSPPKTHDLDLLLTRIGLSLPADIEAIIDMINGVSVPLRYPDSLSRLRKQFNKRKAREILTDTKKVMGWLRRQLS